MPVLGIPEANGTSTIRLTTVKLVSAAELDRQWRGFPAESIIDRRFADGRLMMSVERADDGATGSMRLDTADTSSPATVRRSIPPCQAFRPGAGSACCSLRCCRSPPRFKVFRSLHASAVALDGRALAFVAPSGTGKTSVAAHLVARGASFLTDDALAVEPVPGGLLAHPGQAWRA